MKAGLSPIPHDEKCLQVVPNASAYINSPMARTFTDLKEKKRALMVQELMQKEKKSHPSVIQKLEDHTNAIRR